jgi:NAD(P)-dependent dehydrogenase (short-subunit alcohol dehydrogenase family)
MDNKGVREIMEGIFQSLKGKVIIVVGTGGIGGAIVRDFLKQGCKVFALDKNQKTLQRLGIKKNLKKIIVDVTEKKRYKEVLENIGKKYKPIKSFIYTAGIATPTPVDNFIDGLPEKLFDINVVGFIYGVKYIVPFMEKGSSIIVISSVNAYRSEYQMAVYDSTKAALIQYAKTAAIELGKKGIRVNVVAPGYIRTPQTIQELKNPLTRRIIERATALGRIGEPEDVSSVVVVLCSDDFKFVTGAVVEVSGGLALAQYPPIKKQLNV